MLLGNISEQFPGPSDTYTPEVMSPTVAGA